MKAWLVIFSLLFFSNVVCADVQISRIRIFGNKAVETATLQRVSGARRYDFYKDGFCESIEQRLSRTYQGLGYADVEVKCKLRDDELLIKIIEGKQQIIKSVSIVQGGEEPDKIIKILTPVTASLVGRAVFASALRDWKRQLLYLLRREGYLFSSMQLEVVDYDRLNVSVNPRNRVQFIITGNNEVTNSDILQLLQISDRLSPITTRAIEELPEEIEQLYAEKGYPFAQIQITEQEPEEKLIKYLFQINEGEKTFISDVRIQDEEFLPELDYKENLLTKARRPGPFSLIEPGILNKEKIASDLITLEDKLRAEGYIEAKADYHLDVTAEGIVVKFEIILGKQYQVEMISKDIECPTEIAEIPLIQINVSELNGVLATSENITPHKIAIRDELIKQGFPTPVVDLAFDNTDSSLKVVIHCGDREEVGNVEFEGIVHTNQRYIRSLLRVKPGDLIVKLDRGIERVRASGVFSAVDVRLEDSTSPPINPGYKRRDVKIIFRERDTGVLDTSVSLNTEDGLRLGGELSQRNFRSQAETLSLNADLFINGGDNIFSAGRARAFWKVPNVFGEDRLEFLTEGYLQYDIQNVNQYSFTRQGVDSQLRYRLRKFIFGAGISVFQDNVYDVEKDVIISDRDEGVTFYSFLTSRIEYDQRDSVLAPTHGFYSALVGKFAADAFGSEVNLGMLSLEAKYYSPVSSELVWINGIRGTKIEPFSDTDAVPLSQRIYLGGANSLRGFDRNHISPLGVEGNRAGGDESYVLNSELQWNLTDTFQLASFVDGGRVKIANGGENLETRDSDFRISPGAGIRYRTPVGPLGLDMGFPLDKRPGEPIPRVYFGFNGIF